MRSSVYEIAHCGVDVSRPRLFTCIIGTKGENAQFFCHVFKCESKDAVRLKHNPLCAVRAASPPYTACFSWQTILTLLRRSTLVPVGVQCIPCPRWDAPGFVSAQALCARPLRQLF